MTPTAQREAPEPNWCVSHSLELRDKIRTEATDYRKALKDCELFMSALVEMRKADMAEDHEHGMARFNSGGFVEAIRNARAALAAHEPK